jgi:ketosteroid isomerase-like protein
MSRENVEIVRRSNDAFERGDVAAAMSAVHPDLVTYRPDPDNRTFHGPGGFLEAFDDWVEDFAEFSFAAEEYLDVGDRVLVRIRQWARGKANDVPLEAPVWFLYTLSDGRITHMGIYNAENKALEAAGLSD